MNIRVHYFEYNGKSSNNLQIDDFNTIDLTFGYFNEYEAPINMGRDVIAGTLNRHRNRVNHMGTAWSSVLIFEVNIIKSPCFQSEEREYFTEDELRYITKWLTSPDYPTLLHIYDSGDDAYLEDPETYVDDIYTKYDYYGVFTDIQPIYNGGVIVGITATFTTNSPFAWDKEKVVESECVGTTEVTIEVDNDEAFREIHPLIAIRGTDYGDGRTPVKIINNDDLYLDTYYDNNSDTVISETKPRTLSLNVPGEFIYIDTQTMMISDDIGSMTGGMQTLVNWTDIGLTDLSYIYWPRLFNGTNTWTIIGDCEIKITYREPRKVGAY